MSLTPLDLIAYTLGLELVLFGIVVLYNPSLKYYGVIADMSPQFAPQIILGWGWFCLFGGVLFVASYMRNFLQYGTGRLVFLSGLVAAGIFVCISVVYTVGLGITTVLAHYPISAFLSFYVAAQGNPHSPTRKRGDE